MKSLDVDRSLVFHLHVSQCPYFLVFYREFRVEYRRCRLLSIYRFTIQMEMCKQLNVPCIMCITGLDLTGVYVKGIQGNFIYRSKGIVFYHDQVQLIGTELLSVDDRRK